MISIRKSNVLKENNIIAPLLKDLVIDGGQVFYGVVVDRNDLIMYSKALRKHLEIVVDVSQALIVTLVNLPEFQVESSRNSLQIVVATDGTQSFVIMNYHKVDGNVATGGFSEITCKTMSFGKFAIPSSDLIQLQPTTKAYKLSKCMKSTTGKKFALCRSKWKNNTSLSCPPE